MDLRFVDSHCQLAVKRLLGTSNRDHKILKKKVW